MVQMGVDVSRKLKLQVASELFQTPRDSSATFYDPPIDGSALNKLIQTGSPQQGVLHSKNAELTRAAVAFCKKRMCNELFQSRFAWEATYLEEMLCNVGNEGRISFN